MSGQPGPDRRGLDQRRGFPHPLIDGAVGMAIGPIGENSGHLTYHNGPTSVAIRFLSVCVTGALPSRRVRRAMTDAHIESIQGGQVPQLLCTARKQGRAYAYSSAAPLRPIEMSLPHCLSSRTAYHSPIRSRSPQPRPRPGRAIKQYDALEREDLDAVR